MLDGNGFVTPKFYQRTVAIMIYRIYDYWVLDFAVFFIAIDSAGEIVFRWLL